MILVLGEFVRVLKLPLKDNMSENGSKFQNKEFRLMITRKISDNEVC